MIILTAAALTLAILLGLSYTTARRGGLRTAGTPGTTAAPPGPRVPLLTEALGYLGVVLLLAGGGTALQQQWHDLAPWARVGVLALAAVFFLLVGTAALRLAEPAAQRSVDVLWVLGVALTAAAAGVAGHEVGGTSDGLTCLLAGLAAAACGTVLWLARPRALQNLAVLAGLVLTAVGAVLAIGGDGAPAAAFTAVLWPLGTGWALLGWRGLAEPAWVSLPCGTLVALVAPSFPLPEQGLFYALALASAGGAMAAAVRLRSPALLGLGSVALLGYLTSFVVRYFGDAVGVPATLAVTGVLVVVMAMSSARLLRAVRPDRRPPGRHAQTGPGPR